ncbi:hypothetical protein HDU77_003353 [Chytriomyces hyalinus]|nr:hypothetical protein HDU77_003353 [Chytriomyces hyalinus]
MTEPSWTDAFPTPTSKPARLTREECAALLKDGSLVNGKDFVFVDVRRTDFGGGTVRGAVNVHAQTFFDNLDAFTAEYAAVKKVIFFCNSSSWTDTKMGRGPRCAAWYQDALDTRGIKTSQAFVLSAGVKGWVNEFKDDASLTQDYDEQFWLQA